MKLNEACALLLASATDGGSETLICVSKEHLKTVESLTVRSFKQSKRSIGRVGDCAICDESLGDLEVLPTPIRWLGKRLKPAMVHARCARDYRVSSRSIVWRNQASRFDLETANTCVCTHQADRHEKDDLENLLACKDCDCDHFRMLVASDQIEEMAPEETEEVAA